MNLDLEGKVAIITGGSDGIGKAAALSMSREGARVAISQLGQKRPSQRRPLRSVPKPVMRS